MISVDDVKENSWLLFDDVACENQSNVRAYFGIGKHKLVDSFYLRRLYLKNLRIFGLG